MRADRARTAGSRALSQAASTSGRQFGPELAAIRVRLATAATMKAWKRVLAVPR